MNCLVSTLQNFGFSFRFIKLKYLFFFVFDKKNDPKNGI